jgi:hypothetical protein
MCLLGFFVLNGTEDCLSINILAALADYGIADLTDQDNQASRSVIVGRVCPDHQDHVHNGDEEIRDLGELLAQISELVEETSKCLKILKVLVSLGAGSLDFFLELAEGASVCRLVLLKELKDFLNALGVKLIADSVEVL